MPNKDIDNIETRLDDIASGRCNSEIEINQKESIVIRSEEAQEIIDHKSGPLERWALWIFLCILLLLLTTSGFILYPDILQVRTTLTSLDGPKEIVPNQSGRITQLFVTNGQTIRKGATLAYIESVADIDQMLSLFKRVEKANQLLTDNKLGDISSLFLQPYDQLGEDQSAYQTFMTALQQFNDYYVNGFYDRKKTMLEQDLGALKKMNNALGQQRQIEEQDNELAQENYKMNKKLFDAKIISAEEYRQDQSQLLSKQMALPQTNSSIFSNQNEQREKLKDLEQLDHDVIQQRITMEQALQTLKSALDTWIKQYVLIAPVDGTVYFSKPIQKNQYLQSGKTIGYIATDNNKLFTELYLPQNNLGKADTGMEVQLRFDAYPYQEKGIVKGKLIYISRVVSDSGYLGIVRLNNGLLTSQHQILPYKDGLKADALIITKNMSLLNRLYYNITKATSLNK
ncbi:HlyD family secretion protein [Rhizosphaericola mali]|uniref:HlyD family efflux transporter periplasmic adaptor subunit n=1 Tax=Rhizosphaericola mali TaxID=2545455 RepID=A0A5P2FZX6_9BACT|nr:HlyD family efflux transporter periplasmic adaptor subunit [Rhizosphaericola mali]QES88065.1 HlyD family efflux transporter periplasmic adaptor subunit [Rhizosphaericola mali]QES88785.1 HlyD family efflux transporter periplasmic adaptor subunit [Rhizosphaericola mali]